MEDDGWSVLGNRVGIWKVRLNDVADFKAVVLAWFVTRCGCADR